MKKIVFAFLLLMISSAFNLFSWTPHFQKCPPYLDVAATWVGKNYEQALEIVMPFQRAKDLHKGQWILNVRITPSFFDELQFTFIKNADGTLQALDVIPAEGSISNQLEELKNIYPDQELRQLIHMVKVKRRQMALQPNIDLEKKIRFLQDFKMPPPSKDIYCLDGTGYEVSLQTETRKYDISFGCDIDNAQDVLSIIEEFRDLLYGYNQIDYDLLAALQKNRTEKAIKLIKADANPEFFTAEGERSWLHAVGLGNLELINLMLQNHRTLLRQEQPVSLAARNGSPTVVGLLLESGANVNETNAYGETPLIAASDYVDQALEIIGTTENNFALVVKKLIRAGADLDKKNHGGNTALILATSNRHQEIAMELIEAGADLNAIDNCGNTALIEAARNGDQMISEILVRAGADRKVINAEGKTAMHYALEKGYSELVRILN